MSYLVLARKSRPQSFRDVVGQRVVVRTLQNALQHDRVAQALLFSGVRGTGKTTLARIMAKALNCENRQDSEPCNQCRSCLEITAGSAVDLQEVDGASNRGIQEIRELKERIRFMPTASRYKIIIIDEVHMLTMEAFNALLKTLEEPPNHVYFMFATTELHRVPVTILSRCQRYELKRVARSELCEHFRRLAMAEGVTIEDQALELVAGEAGGSVRDGLSLLDQLFSYCGDQVQADDVTEILGLVSHEVVTAMTRALLEGNLEYLFTLIAQAHAQGVNFKRLSNDLLERFRALVICRISSQPQALVDVPAEELERLAALAAQYELPTLTHLLNILLEGVEQASTAAQPRTALELVFIKAVQVRETIPVAELVSRFDALLAHVDVPFALQENIPQTFSTRALSRQTADEHGPLQVRETLREPVEKKTEPATTTAAPTTSAPADEAPQPLPVQKTPAADKATSGSAPLKQAALDDIDLNKQWHTLLAHIHERQAWMAAALKPAKRYSLDRGRLLIEFEDPADCLLLRNPEHTRVLNQHLCEFFQTPLSVHFQTPEEGNEGDDTLENGLTPRRQRRELANNPLVLTAVEIFNGQVGGITLTSTKQGMASRVLPDEQVTDDDVTEE